jgi:hypothetical protein
MLPAVVIDETLRGRPLGEDDLMRIEFQMDEGPETVR